MSVLRKLTWCATLTPPPPPPPSSLINSLPTSNFRIINYLLRLLNFGPLILSGPGAATASMFHNNSREDLQPSEWRRARKRGEGGSLIDSPDVRCRYPRTLFVLLDRRTQHSHKHTHYQKLNATLLRRWIYWMDFSIWFKDICATPSLLLWKAFFFLVQKGQIKNCHWQNDDSLSQPFQRRISGKMSSGFLVEEINITLHQYPSGSPWFTSAKGLETNQGKSK